MPLVLDLAAATSVGRVRRLNEDAYLILSHVGEVTEPIEIEPGGKEPGGSGAQTASVQRRGIQAGEEGALFLVADGMGGAKAGEVASALARDAIAEFLGASSEDASGGEQGPEAKIREAILHAHTRLVEHQAVDPETRGMGTTLVLAWVREGQVHVGWVGDSRCYLLPRAGTAAESEFPLTEDHTLVGEWVRAGRLTPEEARNHPEGHMLVQSLGDPNHEPKPAVRSRRLVPGTRILLCTDGLTGMLPDPVLRGWMASPDPLEQIVRGMVDSANQEGGHDNITCVLAEVVDPHDVAATDGAPFPEVMIRPRAGFGRVVLFFALGLGLLAAVAFLLVQS